jgi:hypothetical protein
LDRCNRISCRRLVPNSRRKAPLLRTYQYFWLSRPHEHERSVSTHWDRNGKWIEKTMNKEGYAWCVVCGNEIVVASRNPANFPNEEELLEIGHKTSLVPFAYTSPMYPEEISRPAPVNHWAKTNWDGDFYPNVTAKVDGVMVWGDFDSGASRTNLPESLVRTGPLQAWREHRVGHLGSPYRFCAKNIDIELVCADGSGHLQRVTVHIVRDWHVSPFVTVNSTRRCLFIA